MPRRVLVALLLAGMCAGTVLVHGQNAMTRADREFAARMLDDVWKDLQKNYYDPTFHGVDMAARVRGATTALDAAQSVNEAVDILANLLFELDDSHTRFMPPPRANQVNYGWSMAMVGSAPLVVTVDPASDAAKKGLEPGDRVLALNRFTPDERNLWRIKYYYANVRPQAQQRLVVRKPGGEERTIEVISKVERRELVQFIDAVRDAMDEYAQQFDTSLRVQPGIQVWRMTQFRDPDTIRSLLSEARGAKALVLDLRGNGGGQVDGLKSLVGGTFDHEVHLFTAKTRKDEKRVVAKPNGSPFLGPLTVLVDSRSASAAEAFARVVQIEKRGKVVGDRTAGMLMESLTFSHPFGIGNRTWFGASITIADVRMSDGGRLEHVSVVPDEVVLPTPGDLAARRDPALARAIALAGGSLTAEEAGRLFGTRAPK